MINNSNLTLIKPSVILHHVLLPFNYTQYVKNILMKQFWALIRIPEFKWYYTMKVTHSKRQHRLCYQLRTLMNTKLNKQCFPHSDPIVSEL